MKERDADLENGNSDDLYTELSQTLGVQLPQGNTRSEPYQPTTQPPSNPRLYQHSHRNSGGLSIVTSPNIGAAAGVGGRSNQYDYLNAPAQDQPRPPGQNVYRSNDRMPSQTQTQQGGLSRSYSSSLYAGYDEHDRSRDSPGTRSRRPDQLQQRDLDKAKAERMEKRKKTRKLSKNEDEEASKYPTVWVAFSRMVTCCFPPPLLVLLGT